LSHSLPLTDILDRLSHVDPDSLKLFKGIEKEGLRVNDNSEISQLPHPSSLGSALTHPSITTDYSEALLEFITPVGDKGEDVLSFLDHVHRYTYPNIKGQWIWPASMPGVIKQELDVPIAHYGESHLGQLKHVYRHGLWHRYGRKMQCIAGLHFNFSVGEGYWSTLADAQDVTCDQDFVSQEYFGLIRNFRRYSWLLLYLFGASPALDASFVDGREHSLEAWDDDTWYLPYATSLRMSGLGYQNNAQDGLFVCFNGLPTYTNTLKQAMAQTVPAYEQIGVEENGVFKQLNTHLLQIENEYYSDVRPKRNSKEGEKPLTALNRHGVEYIEVRCLDLNPFLPLGIDLEQVAFMDTFLLYCLLKGSPRLASEECDEVVANQKAVVLEGRRPGFTLKRMGETVELKQWASDIINGMSDVADWLDRASGDDRHAAALSAMMGRVRDSSLTPSAKVLETMKQNHLSYQKFGIHQAKVLADELARPLAEIEQQKWAETAEESLKKQAHMESENEGTFAQYLEDYLKKL